jgi:hypothetical protein
MEDGGDLEGDRDDGSTIRMTPTKKLKASGSFEPSLKRKESGTARGLNSSILDRSNFKRRRVWPDTT